MIIYILLTIISFFGTLYVLPHSIKKLRINNFRKLKKIIERNIYKKDFASIFETSDMICLNSKYVTKNLLNYLKN